MLLEVDQLFGELRTLTGPVREEQAKKIIKSFKVLRPTTTILESIPTYFEKVTYLVIITGEEKYSQDRKALTRVFKDAKSQ